MLNQAEKQRLETKSAMIIERGGYGALCDRCATFMGSQMHELIHRSKTSRDSEARKLTYQKELCSFLCIHCHAAIHDHGVDESELWISNYNRYGYETVKNAFVTVEKAMKSKLGIVMPEPEIK